MMSKNMNAETKNCGSKNSASNCRNSKTQNQVNDCRNESDCFNNNRTAELTKTKSRAGMTARDKSEKMRKEFETNGR